MLALVAATVFSNVNHLPLICVGDGFLFNPFDVYDVKIMFEINISPPKLTDHRFQTRNFYLLMYVRTIDCGKTNSRGDVQTNISHNRNESLG